MLKKKTRQYFKSLVIIDYLFLNEGLTSETSLSLPQKSKCWGKKHEEWTEVIEHEWLTCPQWWWCCGGLAVAALAFGVAMLAATKERERQRESFLTWTTKNNYLCGTFICTLMIVYTII